MTSPWVNEQVRGQALTRLEAGQVVFSLQIPGVEPGAPVAFQINGKWAPHSTVWDNTHCVHFDLMLAESATTFLPVIAANGDILPDFP